MGCSPFRVNSHKHESDAKAAGFVEGSRVAHFNAQRQQEGLFELGSIVPTQNCSVVAQTLLQRTLDKSEMQSLKPEQSILERPSIFSLRIQIGACEMPKHVESALLSGTGNFERLRIASCTTHDSQQHYSSTRTFGKVRHIP